MAEAGFAHWAKIAENPNNPQFAFAEHITNTPKTVFTTTLQSCEWENTTIAKGDLAEEITKSKNQSGKGLITYGGATFVSSLIKAGLIDEFHLIVNPTALVTECQYLKN